MDILRPVGGGVGAVGGIGVVVAPYGPILREHLSASGVRYGALGHIHQYSGVLRDGLAHRAWAGLVLSRSSRA